MITWQEYLRQDNPNVSWSDYLSTVNIPLEDGNFILNTYFEQRRVLKYKDANEAMKKALDIYKKEKVFSRQFNDLLEDE